MSTIISTLCYLNSSENAQTIFFGLASGRPISWPLYVRLFNFIQSIFQTKYVCHHYTCASVLTLQVVAEWCHDQLAEWCHVFRETYLSLDRNLPSKPIQWFITKTGILPHRASSTCDKKLSIRTSIQFYTICFPNKICMPPLYMHISTYSSGGGWVAPWSIWLSDAMYFVIHISL